MAGPSGNSEFCFPSNLNEVSGKQNSLFPLGPVIKRLISHSIFTPEDRLDRFSRNTQATNWIEVMKKMADNLNYFPDDKESEWLANIDPSLLE